MDSFLSEFESFYKFIIEIQTRKVYKKYVHIYGIMLYNEKKNHMVRKAEEYGTDVQIFL